MKNNEDIRTGFHSIENIISFNPFKIKKIFLPSLRDDKRIENLIELANKNNISFEISKKLKKEPQAIIKKEKNLDLKDLKKFIDENKNKEF